jgi:hypothetical protein
MYNSNNTTTIILLGTVHKWGTKKECLTGKGLQRTNLDFHLSYHNYSGLLYANT